MPRFSLRALDRMQDYGGAGFADARALCSRTFGSALHSRYEDHAARQSRAIIWRIVAGAGRQPAAWELSSRAVASYQRHHLRL